MPLRAVLLDLEGVLYQEGRPIEGCAETLSALRERGLALRFLTNTTTTSRAGVLRRLQGIGLDVEISQLFTPLAAARGLLGSWGCRRIHLAAPPETAEDFTGLEIRDEGPVDAVVMGDLYKGYDWDRLNLIFGLVHDGARLIALHKNRRCRRGDAIALDAGPFVAAVEYAAGVEAVVVGKPAAAFFQQALDNLGVAADEAVMVGDDIEADIGGAQSAGIAAVQVRTGKFTAADLEHAGVAPEARIGSIADLPAVIAERFGGPPQ